MHLNPLIMQKSKRTDKKKHDFVNKHLYYCKYVSIFTIHNLMA